MADPYSCPCHSCNILAQIGRKDGRHKTFCQPLTLTECIRSLLKKLEMFSSDEVCGGKPPKWYRTRALFLKSLGALPRVPPSMCFHRTVDPLAGCTLVILVYMPLWTIELHKPCMRTCTCDTTHTDPVSWQLLPNPDFVYIAVNTDFYGFWFAFSPHSFLVC